MNTKIITIASIAIGLTACSQEPQQDVQLDTDAKKFSYAMGMSVGNNIKNLNADIDSQAFSQAVADTLAGNELKLTTEESAKVQQAFFEEKQKTQVAKQKAIGEENQLKGEAYLEENAKKEGVTVTESGLQYEVLVQGSGDKPAATDTVEVHYQGTLIDGTEFDSSYSRGQPISFPLNGVIKGWTEGVALMPVGSKYKFTIPSALAYGERGAGAKIGPNSTLVFEVELLAIKEK